MPAREIEGVSPFTQWLLGAVGGSIAETATLPIDVTKVRLQLQNELVTTGATQQPYRGMVATAVGIAKEEGPLALYKGLPAALLRQSIYGGIGIGFYKNVRAVVAGDNPNPSFAQRFLAGSITGGFGQLVVCPLDVVKVRLQADGKTGVHRYTGTFNALWKIPQEEGLLALTRGVGPSVSRAVCINGAGIATYDSAKGFVTGTLGFADSSVVTHVGVAMLSGLVSAGVSAPWDVVKTRIMNQPQGSQLYSGVIDCFRKTIGTEGPMALYKGFIPTWSRLGPWQLVFFTVYEQMTMAVTGKSF